MYNKVSYSYVSKEYGFFLIFISMIMLGLSIFSIINYQAFIATIFFFIIFSVLFIGGLMIITMSIVIDFKNEILIIKHYFINKKIEFKDIKDLYVKNNPPSERFGHRFELNICFNDKGKDLYRMIVFEKNPNLTKRFSMETYNELEKLKDTLLKIKNF